MNESLRRARKRESESHIETEMREEKVIKRFFSKLLKFFRFSNSDITCFLWFRV